MNTLLNRFHMKIYAALFFSALFFLLPWQSPLSAQIPVSKVLSLQEKVPIRPDVRMGELSNGFRYYIAYNPKPENRAELRLAVNVGSVQEDEDQLGVAHFVEHLAFNGSTHFEKNELVNYLELTGTRFGADLNAYTSFDETVYILQARSDSLELLEKGLLIFEDWAYGITFEEEEINKERGVVVSEWRTRLSADQRMQQKTFPVMYKGSRYAERLPIGKPEIIETIKPERIKQFYKDWYRPDLMAIVAVGDFDLDWMENQIRERFSKVPKHPNPRIREEYSVPGHKETLYSIVSDEEAAFTRATIEYKHKNSKVKTLGDYRENIIQNFYNRMLNARMQEVGRQAEPPFTFAYAGYGGDVGDLATYTAYAFTAEGGAIRGLEAVLTEVKRAQTHGFVASELERQKVQMMRFIERAYKERDKVESSGLAMNCVYHFLDQSTLIDPEQTLALYQQFIPDITLQELNEIGKNWITEENRVVTITGPEKEGSPLPTETELEAMFDRFAEMTVEPYTEEIGNEPLLAKELKETAIVKELYFDSVDVHELELANGVKIILKSTDFKNDEILMSSFSPGGHSLYEDADYQTASRAASIIAEGGVGDFDYLNLEKKLAGKTVNVGPYISELYEGINGNCSPEDFETMLQLVYLYFNKPRKELQSLVSFVNRQKSFLKNMGSDPEYYYAMVSASVRYNNHLRRQAIPTMEDMDELDLDRALEVYKDRFADASDFTFILVGNFVVEEIKPLLSTYLGNLPNIGRKEKWRDVEANLAEGQIDSTIVRGQAPKARVNITFHGDIDYDNPQTRYEFSSMISVLNIKMRESMREDKGGVYGVSLRGNTFRDPKPLYTINLSFTCDPGELDDLIATAMKDIENAKQNGAAEQDLQKVTETQRQGVIKNLKENSFWAGQLSARYREGKSINNIGLALLEKRIAKLDATAIKKAAQQFFNMDNMIKLSLVPEKTEEK